MKSWISLLPCCNNLYPSKIEFTNYNSTVKTVQFFGIENMTVIVTNQGCIKMPTLWENRENKKNRTRKNPPVSGGKKEIQSYVVFEKKICFTMLLKQPDMNGRGCLMNKSTSYFVKASSDVQALIRRKCIK